MVVPGPRGNDEDVALVPFEPLAVDDRRALAAEDLVDRRADVAMILGLLHRLEELDLAGEGRERRPARHRVRVGQQDPVVGIALGLGFLQGSNVASVSSHG